MMNIVAFLASPNEEGHSAQMLRAYLAPFEGENIRLVRPYALAAQPCNDCGACQKSPMHCPIDDGMQPLFAALEAADLIVLATPMYYNSVPAPMKAVMDRTMCLFCKRFVHKLGKKGDKAGVLLASAGAQDARAEAALCAQVKQLFDVCFAGMEEPILCAGTDRGAEAFSGQLARCRSAAEALKSRLERGKHG